MSVEQGYSMGKDRVKNKKNEKQMNPLELREIIYKKLELADAVELRKVISILVKKGFYRP